MAKDTTTSNLVVGRKESVTDELLLLNPHQIPLLSMLGFSAPATNTEHIWYEDEMFGATTTVTGAVDESATEVDVADATIFRKDHIVLVGDEYVKVTAVNASGNKLTVERGYAGTDAAAIEDGDKLDIQFLEGEEGMDAVDARYKPRKRVSNATQIFTDSINISGTQLAVENHNIDNFYAYEKDKVQTLLALQLEKAALNGVYMDNGTIRKARGIRNFIKTNVMQNAGKLSADKISDAIQAIYTAGGFANGGSAGYEIVVGPTLKRAVSNFDKSVVRIAQEEGKRGTVVNYLTTDFGEFPVSINNNLKEDEVLIIDKNRIKLRPLKGREFNHEYLGKQGDYVKGMIVGEYTVEVQQEKAHALIKGATV